MGTKIWKRDMKWISTGENRDGGSPKEKRKQMDKYRLKQRAGGQT